MSLISVLGFRPSSSSSSSESTHWAILISPHPPSAKTQKSKSRFFRPKITNKEPQSDSALFDMKRHQLRQQQFPIPLKEAENSTESTNRPSETPSEQVAITTLDAECSHPLPLILQISASILAQTPQRLIPRLSQRLYHTPTYGSEDDWLRAALSLMHDILLEPGFDVDRFVEYATSAAKEYTMYEASSEEQDNNEDRPVQQQSDTETEYSAVLTLDYTAHLAQNASVKAMLNREPQQQLTPPESPRLQHVKQEQQQRLGEGQGQKKPRTWLGFRISTSPNAQSRRMADRYSFERQDDPYGGLM